VSRGLILLIPFAAIVATFLALDPFHLLREAPSPLVRGALMNDRVFQARWLDRHRGAYDAFILGSSRSKAFRTDDWSRYLPDAVRPFHMGINDETVYGIARKVQFLDRAGFSLRYVLLSLDARILGRFKNPEPHVFREHPLVSGEAPTAFYQRFFLAFLDPRFLRAYTQWRATGTAPPGSEAYLWTEKFGYVAETGDHLYTSLEEELAAGEDAYYARRSHVLRRGDPVASNRVITTESRRLLGEMAAVLLRHRAETRVVVTPNFDRAALHPEDRQGLQTVFGRARVWDFSGSNEMTGDVRNYYEERHFRPHVARAMLARVYGEPDRPGH
jgi:hypothetical protein